MNQPNLNQDRLLKANYKIVEIQILNRNHIEFVHNEHDLNQEPNQAKENQTEAVPN